jgi:hypothetical protein
MAESAIVFGWNEEWLTAVTAGKESQADSYTLFKYNE